MLSFLTNLRDMKSSLSSGMLVLFTLWLVFGNQVAEVEQGDSLAGNLRRLADYIGPVGSLGVVAFVAYLLGLVLSLDRVAMAILVPQRWLSGTPQTSSKGVTAVPTTYLRLENKLNKATNSALKKAPASFVEKSIFSDEAQWVARVPETSQILQFRLNNRLMNMILSDLDILAVQLHRHDKTYDKYDKAQTEASFRAGLVIPIGFLGVVLAVRLVQENLPWLGGAAIVTTVFASYSLLRKAAAKRREANEEVLNALIVGDIEFAPLTVLADIASGTLRPEDQPSASVASPAGKKLR